MNSRYGIAGALLQMLDAAVLRSGRPDWPKMWVSRICFFFVATFFAHRFRACETLAGTYSPPATIRHMPETSAVVV